jgi:plastocyanin
MTKKILSNMRTYKVVCLASMLMTLIAILILHQINAAQAISEDSSNLEQDGGGFSYEYEDVPADSLPSENLATTTAPTDTLDVDTRYITNGSSAAGYRTYTVQVIETLWYAWNRGLDGVLYPSSDTKISGWVSGLTDPNITIGYDFGVYDITGAQRIPEGSTIEQGTQVVMKFSNYVSDNIFWFGTGYSMDSPYGEWRANAAATPRVANKVTCDTKDLTQKYTLTQYSNSYTFDVYMPFVVNPPQRNLANLNGFTCGSLTNNTDGSMSAVCTATGNGTTTPTFNYDATYGKFYYRYYDYRDMTDVGWGGPGCYGNNIAMSDYFGPSSGPATQIDTTIRSPYVVNIPNQSYSYPIVIGATGNKPPTTPTLTCSGSVQVGQDISVTLTATDEENDQVRYAVGWFSNSSPDSGWTSLVNSGTSGTLTKTGGYSTPGTYTVYGWAQDANGATSGSSSCTITVTDLPVQPPTAMLDAQVGSGPLISDPNTVTADPGDSVTLSWRGTDITNCTATAGNGFAASGISGNDSITIPAPGNSETYSISCTGPEGSATDSLIVSVNQYPNLTQPNITYQLSPTFSATTGYYDWVDVTFNTTNESGSDTRSSSDYKFEFDRNLDGYEHTPTGSLGILTVGQTVTRTERVTGNIPFGNSRVQVTVDNTNAVQESNETDNTRSLDIALPPPDPGLNLSTDKQRVRQGETANLTWTVNNPYAGISCRVYGPSTSYTGTSGTNQPTAAIQASSVYTLECTVSGTTFKKTVTVETEGSIEEV